MDATLAMCYKIHMTLSIGIRELRQHASRYLRLIEERGEPIEITDRGRPVALLGPLPTGGTLERLRASGRLRPATRPWAGLPTPAEPAPGEKSLSEILEELRADER
jgi:prevent-host-death family protein